MVRGRWSTFPADRFPRGRHRFLALACDETRRPSGFRRRGRGAGGLRPPRCRAVEGRGARLPRRLHAGTDRIVCPRTGRPASRRTYVPKYPSRLYERGRAHGWLRETLEGSIFLLYYKLIAPGSPGARWILKDYEDNLYISNQYGYEIPAFDAFWFSRGGFSMQAQLLDGPPPYLYRMRSSTTCGRTSTGSLRRSTLTSGCATSTHCLSSAIRQAITSRVPTRRSPRRGCG